MSSRTLSAVGQLSSPPLTGGRTRLTMRLAPLFGYALAGGASLLVWAGVLSLALLILR